MTEDTLRPSEALAAAEAARARMAQAADCPPWRHAAFGGLMGAVTASQAADPPWSLGILVLILIATGALVAYDRATKGVWLNGYRRGATRKVMAALLAAFFVIYSGAVLLKFHFGVGWAPLVGGVLIAVIATFASRRWTEAYRREMGART